MNKKQSLKKIAALAANLVLAFVFVIALFVGCNKKEEYNLENAKSYVDSLYKSAATETGADFERVGKVKIDGVDYEVVWTVDVNSGVTVSKKDSGDYLIDIDENAENDVAYVLTGTIKAPNGETITVTYNHTVPKFKELTWAQFTNTEDEKAVVIKRVSGLFGISRYTVFPVGVKVRFVLYGQNVLFALCETVYEYLIHNSALEFVGSYEIR